MAFTLVTTGCAAVSSSGSQTSWVGVRVRLPSALSLDGRTSLARMLSKLMELVYKALGL